MLPIAPITTMDRIPGIVFPIPGFEKDATGISKYWQETERMLTYADKM